MSIFRTSFKNIKKLPDIIFFDYDGTIAKDYCLPKAFRYAIKKNLSKAVVKKILQIKKDADQWEYLKENVDAETFKKCSEDYDLYIRRREFKPVSGSMRMLKYLKQSNIKTYIVSQKGGEGLREDLRHRKLERYFTGAYGTLDFGDLRKPDLEFVEAVKKDIKYKNEECWMIGDRHSDVLTAINMQCKAFIIDKNSMNEILTKSSDLIGKSVFFTSYRRLLNLVKQLKKNKINKIGKTI